jgi:hypothetical protein
LITFPSPEIATLLICMLLFHYRKLQYLVCCYRCFCQYALFIQ